MNSPLISVIIPTYNRQAELSELLESISRQNYANLQIIIANDKGEPVEPVTAKFPELTCTIINMETNLKHVHARNRALQEVKGEYILLCDDDDLLLPGHIDRMLEALQDCDLAYSDVEIFEYEWRNGCRHATKRMEFAYEFSLAEMRKFSTFVASGCMYKASLHDTLGPFDVEMYHYWDWDFFLRAAEQFRVRRVPVASALYAFASQQSTNMSSNLDNMAPYLEKLSAKHDLGELPTKNFFLLLEEPGVVKRKAKTRIIWDGQPICGRE